ncbi:MAG: sigma-70 family RNA polymerase sigma factor [Candidatus Omnitrophica bacterium]|nr:sigma-70 family RNA polymerase sigma factor [Candidatus Omnitrophota bacterium]
MTGAVTADNKDIILKAQEGDMFAFRVLVDVHKEQAVRIAYAITGNLADAQDVAQEAFIRIYKNINSFRFDSRFSTWLYRIVVNLGHDLLRKRKRLKVVFDNDNDARQVQIKDEKGADPGKKLLSVELKAKIEAALTSLPEKQRIVFSLKYKKDMKIREIAQLMGVSVSTVKMHLFRAIDKMQKKLREYVR